MKKVFLLFGIIGCTTTFAQQKDVLDINRYLQKRNADTLKLFYKNNNGLDFRNPIQKPPSSTSLNLNTVLPNGDKVFTSPSYHMPVVIPDMTSLSTFPNVIKDYRSNLNTYLAKVPGSIPNNATPFTITK